MKKFNLLSVIALVSGCLEAAPPSGTVVEWGEAISAEPGVRPGGFRTRVVAIAGKTLTNVTGISAGLSHALALTSDGSVLGWGAVMGRTTAQDGRVVLEDGLLGSAAAISAYLNSIVLLHDGKLITWDHSGSATRIDNLPNDASIAAGFDYYLALRKDGMIRSWGRGNPPPAWLTNVSAIAVSKSFAGHGLALTKERAVIAWALGHGSSCLVRGATNVVAIAAGQTHYLALTSEGTVCEWGYYAYPNLAGNGLTGIPANDLSSHMVEVNGKRLTDIIAIAAGASHSLALKRNGSIIAWGIDRQRKGTNTIQLDVPAGLRGVIAISAGDGFSLALTTNNPALPNAAPKR